MGHKREYKERLGDKLSVHTEEHKTRTTEKEIDEQHGEFVAAVKTYLEKPSDFTKKRVKDAHEKFLEETHKEKILLQKMENELISKIITFYREEEKKLVKEYTLEQWEDIVDELNSIARDVLEMVSWEKRQEIRMKRGRRPRPEEWHLFKASSTKRRRMMSRAKHARHASKKGKNFIDNIHLQKNRLEVLWRENERRQHLLRKSIKLIQKNDGKLADELRGDEKEESVKTRKSLKFFKRKVRGDIDDISPSRKQLRGWKKVATTAAIATGIGVGVANQQATAQSFDIKDRVKNVSEQVRGVVQGKKDALYMNSNKQAIAMKGFGDGEVLINYYNKGSEKSPMEEVVMYNKQLEPLYVFLNTKQGDNKLDHVYRVFYDRVYGHHELVEMENIRSKEFIQFFMKAKNTYRMAMQNSQSKFVFVRKPFDYRMAKLRKGLIQTEENFVKGLKALVGK